MTGAMGSPYSAVIWRTAVFWASVKADQPDASVKPEAKLLLVGNP